MSVIKKIFFSLLGIKNEEEIRKIVKDEITRCLAESHF